MAPGSTAPTMAWPSIPPGCRISPRCSSRPPRAAACREPASSISRPARSPTAARCSTTSATACSSPSRRPDEYTRACFKQYGLLTDKSGWYGSMWRPFHLIGLETCVSVLSAVLRGEPTGSQQGIPRRRRRHREERPQGRRHARRRRRLRRLGQGDPGAHQPGRGRLADRPCAQRQAQAPVAKDQIVRMSDVELVDDLDVVDLRKEQVRAMGPVGAGLKRAARPLRGPGRPPQ